KTIMPARQGDLHGGDIPAEHVLLYRPDSVLECIVMGMATMPPSEKPRRTQYRAKLISGFIDFLYSLAKKHIIITKLYATSVTPTGIALLRHTGFHEIGHIGKRIAFELDTLTWDSPFAKAYR